MRPSALLCGFPLAVAASYCQYEPSENATAQNYPGSESDATTAPYDLGLLSAVPVADVCNSGNSTAELACARQYINAIDEQIAFLYARRLGYAAVAGFSKFRSNTSLNDPSRNSAVAESMAQKVLKYGGSKDAGTVMAGEGCQIYASLEFEAASIQQSCAPAFDEEFTRTCN